MEIARIIENIYSDIDLIDEESNFIWDCTNIYKDITNKNNSRYKLSGINYKPYILTKETFSNLFRRLLIVPSLNNKTKNEIINYNNEKAIIYDLTINMTPVYNGDLTPAGLLNVRLGSANGNSYLFNKVNEYLSEFMTLVNTGLMEYWIYNELLPELNCSIETRSMIIRSYGFSWRLK